MGLLTTVTLQLGRKQFMRPVDAALIFATFAEVSLMHVSLLWALLTVGGLAVWIYRPRDGLAAIITSRFAICMSGCIGAIRYGGTAMRRAIS